MNTKQKGFTLVEIAIVLVIVGLLLGAVLKGQELIFNSKVKASYNLSRELSAAIYSYQDRYKQLPGDDTAAASRFPSASPVPTNGNGDGRISWGGTCQTGQQTGENCRAIYGMRLAGFLTGVGLDPLPFAGGGIATLAEGSTMVPGATTQAGLGLIANTVSHKMLSAIDTSFDDGNPATGNVRCRGLAAYDLANPDDVFTSWCMIVQ
ncbi:MAG: type II secretion system protein [Lautropia sp.]